MPNLDIDVLNRLRAAAGEFVPLEELSADVAAVCRELDALASFGFGIERHPYRGAAYAGPAARLCPDQIEHQLATHKVGRRIAVWNRVSSTNDLAARAGASASNDGLVVLAEEQTAGRGRRGRAWSAPPCSSILMSALLFPPPALLPVSSDSAFGCAWLTVLAAIAVAEVVNAHSAAKATIKWPNDVRVAGRKIAGILVERVPVPLRAGSIAGPDAQAEAHWGAIIGIGLNVNLDHDALPPEVAHTATSLQIAKGGLLLDRSEVARDLIRRLDRWYCACEGSSIEILNGPWFEQAEHSGRPVRLTTTTGSLEGRLAGLDVRSGLQLAMSTCAREDGAQPDGPGLTCIPLADVVSVDGLSDDDS
jgi:BirA family biotin operon repressor/biotin-[acetyl-CoA-carboxylase] ligase